ncbi:hypothetical protein L332_03600 [Agrococcus pavilionensis RW1]|uniref:Uncharacterized protein n=1 Tax=Agrococcus pavilionensis RW1 TaxID=1330458 RepID=U1MNR3_9MICO|nr:hypothetical protein [Agrococcus pavilionensis]ERG63536.1 hypothetical protein L332_03600 [Agrococcus pavilionensis RW1]
MTTTTTGTTGTAQRTDARGMFFVPALALAAAGLIAGIASLPNSFESAIASLVALAPTIAALVLGHITAAAPQAPTARRITLGGLGVAYVALALAVLSLLI